MFKSYLFRVLVGVTVVTVAGGIYLTFGNKAQIFSENQNNTVSASVWDKPSESYAGNKNLIDGYVIEGHIPAHDIKLFLKQKPKFAGLAVPGMPLGTPGMEAGERKQPFDILAFNKTGEIKVFQSYNSY